MKYILKSVGEVTVNWFIAEREGICLHISLVTFVNICAIFEVVLYRGKKQLAEITQVLSLKIDAIFVQYY